MFNYAVHLEAVRRKRPQRARQSRDLEATWNRYGDIDRREFERHRTLTDELGRRRDEVAEEAAERRAALPGDRATVQNEETMGRGAPSGEGSSL